MSDERRIEDEETPVAGPDELQAIGSCPSALVVERGLRMLTGEISKFGSPVTFAFVPDSGWAAKSRPHAAQGHVITFSTGLFTRVVALFRQLSLTNAFGKYSQVSRFDQEALETLITLPGIDGFRQAEPAVPIDTLLNRTSDRAEDHDRRGMLIARPPLDEKHRFDMQSLVSTALVFAFWHELAHIVNGHFELLDENRRPIVIEGQALDPGFAPDPEDARRRRALEYVADEFAARRIAGDILQSANVEAGRYVFGPFWFDRSGFEVFGKRDGLPGDEIEFNLEGYLYRVAFAIVGLALQLDGFFAELHTDRERDYPHAEIRLSRIGDVVADQLSASTGLTTYVGDLWSEAFGYALHTLDLGLMACGATRLPLDQFRRFMGGKQHDLEIRARLRVAAADVEAVRTATEPFRDERTLAVLEPGPSIHRPLPVNRLALIELKADAGPPMYQGPATIAGAIADSGDGAMTSTTDETMQALGALAAASTKQERQAIIDDNSEILLTDLADAALVMWAAEVAGRDGPDSSAVRHLEKCRTLLDLCRRHGVDAPRAIDSMSIVNEFIGAGSWPDCRRIIDENPDIMLGDMAEQAMKLLIAGAADNHDLARELGQHRRLLERCRTVGVDRAFAEAHKAPADIFHSRNVAEAVVAFVNAESWDESRHIVEDNTDLLLSDGADEVLGQLIHINRSSRAGVDTLKDHRALLADCRRRGVRRAFKDL